jgi:Uncharacterised nucleotidyltransferase
VRSVEGITRQTRNELEQAYFVALRSHACALNDLAIAAEAFAAAGTPWLTFKGPVLAEHVYRRADLRSYGDLDILVSPQQLQRAVAALEASGGQLLDRNWHLVLEHMRGQLHVLMPSGTTVDLHWNLLNDTQSRRTFPVDVDDLLARRRTVEIGGHAVPTLASEDTLVHLALHACTSGGNRLIACKDLEQVILGTPVNWDAVIERAHQWHAGQATAVMLIFASRALDFEVQSEMTRALSPGPIWRRLARLADRLAPVETWSGGDSLIRDLCRTTREDDRASTYALARRFASFAKSRTRVGPHKVDRDPTSPTSLLFPGGGEHDRAAYFSAVAQSAAPDTGKTGA